MTYKDTEILIQKYLNGETTAEEERLLAMEVSRDDAPDDWKVIAEMLGELAVDEALFDQMMAERRSKSRIAKLWPWVAAACVAALLMVFLGPPRKDAPSTLQIAKVETRQKPVQPKVEVAEAEQVEPKAEKPQSVEKPRKSHKAVLKKNVSKRIIEEEKEPVKENATLRPVEEGDIVPYEDPMMQFSEQTRALRERGNRVIQRVSMNGIPSNNYQLNDL